MRRRMARCATEDVPSRCRHRAQQPVHSPLPGTTPRYSATCHMRHRNPQDRRCTYLVVIERDREPATISASSPPISPTSPSPKCEVIVVDGSPRRFSRSNRARPPLGGAARRRAAAASQLRRRRSTRVRAASTSLVRQDHRRRRERPLRRATPSRASASCSTRTKSSSRRTTSSRCRGGAGSRRDGCSSIAASSRCPTTARRSASASPRCADCAASTSSPGRMARMPCAVSHRKEPKSSPHATSSCDVCRRRSITGCATVRARPATTSPCRSRPRSSSRCCPLAIVLAAIGGFRLAGGYAGAIALRIDGPRIARPRRRDDVLPVARMPLRAALGAGTIGQRLLGALPQTARLID